MIFVVIIFLIVIVAAFGMLTFRAWEIRTSRVQIENTASKTIPELPFRQLEKIMLYLTKHIVQGIVLLIAKYWFIFVTKVRKWFSLKWPKINAWFKKESNSSYRHSFLRRAILESKAKIKHIKQKVKEEVGEHNSEIDKN